MTSPERFILVDDDPINNLLCNHVIKKNFGSVDNKIFTKPEKAISFIEEEYSKLASGPRTVLLLDINMPSMTGWEFLDNLRKFGGHTLEQLTIFILSSSVDQRDKDKAALEPLISGFISKPLTAININHFLINKYVDRKGGDI